MPYADEPLQTADEPLQTADEPLVLAAPLPPAPEPDPVPVPVPQPEPPLEPPLRLEYAVQYRGMPDPETLEGRIWWRGRSHYLPEAIARRLVAADSRFAIMQHPPPRRGVSDQQLLRRP